VCSADIDETLRVGETPTVYLERIVSAKLHAVLTALPRIPAPGGVLVADTIVIAPDGALLGKPKSDAEGRSMIARLEGAAHEVRTRFALAPGDTGTSGSFAQTVTTRVTFRRLAAGEIDAYVASGEGRDKAGAYAVQGRAGAFVERIDGSYTSVVGLPLCEVVVGMRGLGWLI
jgi:septum formation protein